MAEKKTHPIWQRYERAPANTVELIVRLRKHDLSRNAVYEKNHASRLMPHNSDEYDQRKDVGLRFVNRFGLKRWDQPSAKGYVLEKVREFCDLSKWEPEYDGDLFDVLVYPLSTNESAPEGFVSALNEADDRGLLACLTQDLCHMYPSAARAIGLLAPSPIGDKTADTISQPDAPAGRAEASASASAASGLPAEFRFRIRGDKWDLRFRDEEGIFSGLGFKYIAELLQRPDMDPINAYELAGTDTKPDGPRSCIAFDEAVGNRRDSSRPLLTGGVVESPKDVRDTEAVRAKALELLNDKLASATASGDGPKVMELQEQIVQLKKMLKSDPSGSEARVAADTALKAIRRAVERIRPSMPELAKHLDVRIRRDDYDFSYRPEKHLPWALD